MSQQHLEIERKYELEDVNAPLPEIPWEELDGFSLQEPVLEEMDATYFDTENQALGKARVAVRRRLGGYDEGWHIKFDDHEGGRHEVHFPLLSQKKRQPAAVGVYLRGVTAGAELVETVSLATRRVRTVVLDKSAQPLAEICQDSVRAFHFAEQQERIWNEWEIELINPASDEVESLFEQCEYLLADAGIQPSQSAAKIARALGQDQDFEIRRGAAPQKVKKSKKKHKAVETKDVVSRLLSVALKNFALADLKTRGDAQEFAPDLKNSVDTLGSTVRFALAPYLVEEGTLDPIFSAVAELSEALASATHDKNTAAQLEETEQQGGAILAESFVRVKESAETERENTFALVDKFLNGARYLSLVKELYRIVTIAENEAEFPLNPENYFNKVNKRIRKTLIKYRSESASALVGEFLADVEDAFRCYELLQISSATWTAGQIELRATVADIARRAQELENERVFQNWCQKHAENASEEERLALGFLWGKSSYYESGLSLGFVSFAQHELELIKKLKLK